MADAVIVSTARTPIGRAYRLLLRVDYSTIAWRTIWRNNVLV